MMLPNSQCKWCAIYKYSENTESNVFLQKHLYASVDICKVKVSNYILVL